MNKSARRFHFTMTSAVGVYVGSSATASDRGRDHLILLADHCMKGAGQLDFYLSANGDTARITFHRTADSDWMVGASANTPNEWLETVRLGLDDGYPSITIDVDEDAALFWDESIQTENTATGVAADIVDYFSNLVSKQGVRLSASQKAWYVLRSGDSDQVKAFSREYAA